LIFDLCENNATAWVEKGEFGLVEKPTEFTAVQNKLRHVLSPAGLPAFPRSGD